MNVNENSGSQGEPDIDQAESAGSAMADAQVTESKSSSNASVQLSVEREISFEEEEEEMEDKIQSWGVYLAGSEKTLIGLFWDQEIAKFFKEAIQESPILNTLKQVSEKNNNS